MVPDSDTSSAAPARLPLPTAGVPAGAGAVPGPPPTLLPADGPDASVAALLRDRVDPADAARAHPASMLAWAVLADRALAAAAREGGGEDGATAGAPDVEAFAFARVGYHRGLDALRRAGWRGAGPVPWHHEPNRGFLRALAALARASQGLGEVDEAQRCTDFLRACDPDAAARLAGAGSLDQA